MAGHGSRFAVAGYTDPKPLIKFGGRTMIQWIIENIRPARPHRFIFICLAEHLERYPQLRQELEKICPGSHIVTVDRVTEGAACTVLLARRFIDNEDALMIANSDQYVDISIEDYLQQLDETKADGLIMTFWSDHPKWSYCRLGSDGTVTEVVEKKVISNDATVGIYNFARGKDFVQAADTMIARNLRVNDEFYVAPTYNLLIENGAKIVVMSTGSDGKGMHGLGTPEDLQRFIKSKTFLKKLSR